MTKQIVAALAVGLALSASAGFAQTSTMSHSTMSHSTMSTMHKPMHAMTAAKPVYVCKTCKEYFAPAAAKKMGYKDGMGHNLTKMSKAPAGFMDGAHSKM